MTRAGKIAAAALAIALAAGAGYWHLAGSPADAPAVAAPAPARTVAVEAAPVTVETFDVEIGAVGTLQSDESVIVRTGIPGRVARLPLKEGDRVRQGQALVELDATILRAELAQAEANLQLSEANNERTQTLSRQGAATARSRDEAVAKLASDRAMVALARARLEKTTIAAPFDGVLGLRSVSVGAYVTPADNLVNLENIDPMKVDFRLPEIYWPSLRAGQRIAISVDALPGRTFQGEIYAIDPLIDANGRSIRLRARVPNPDRILTPGLFARVSVIVEVRENAIFVPESAIVPQERDKFVYRVEGGRAVLTPVELGQRRTGMVEITGGLVPGATVVTAGQIKLRDGAAIEVVAPAGGASEGAGT